MLQSHIIDIDGAFVGAAVRLSTGYRFVAVDPRLEDIDARIFASLDDIRRLARSLILTGRFPAAASQTRPRIQAVNTAN